MNHDPSRKDEARAVKSAGGVAAGAARRAAKIILPAGVPKPPKTLEDAVHWSSWAMHAVATGQCDARTGHEIGYLIAQFKAAVEKRDLEKEIQALRKQLEDAQKRPARAS